MATSSGSRRGGGASATQTPSSQGSGVDQNCAGGASKYLANLPSRGLLSSTVLSSSLGGIRVYICDHDTSPPEEQQIKTNPTNILIRSLQLKKQRSDAKEGKAKVVAENNRSKRVAERSLEATSLAKKANVASGSASTGQDGSLYIPSDKELKAFTVERLRRLLKEKGLSARGKKDELISRLKDD